MQATQHAQVDRRKKANTSTDDVLDSLDKVLGNYTKSLDKGKVLDDVLDDYVARHSLLVRSLAYSRTSCFISFEYTDPLGLVGFLGRLQAERRESSRHERKEKLEAAVKY